MQISLDFLAGLKHSKIMKVQKIPRTHHTYEYATQIFNEGTVMGTLNLEGWIVDDEGNSVGNFGVVFQHNILVYNIKKDIKESYKL